MRLKQEYMVFAVVLLLLFGVAFYVSDRQGSSNHRAKVQAVWHVMETVYDEAISIAHGEEQQKPWLSTETLRGVLAKAHMPSFVTTADVFLPLQGVSIPSDDLMCVIRMGDDDLYGLTAARTWRVVSRAEFDHWRHESI